jgi:hypothetical protein
MCNHLLLGILVLTRVELAIGFPRDDVYAVSVETLAHILLQEIRINPDRIIWQSKVGLRHWLAVLGELDSCEFGWCIGAARPVALGLSAGDVSVLQESRRKVKVRIVCNVVHTQPRDRDRGLLGWEDVAEAVAFAKNNVGTSDMNVLGHLVFEGVADLDFGLVARDFGFGYRFFERGEFDANCRAVL